MSAEIEVLPAGQLTLFDLATVANREHALAFEAGMSMIDHAISAGDALIEAKTRLRHGEWLPWLVANFDASEATAQRYMQLAANPARVRDLEEPSLRKALEVISGVRRDQPPPVETPPLPDGSYRCIVADPPWDVRTGPGWAGHEISQPVPYPTMGIQEIAALPVGERAAEDAYLYLWTINRYVADAYEIVREWGFKPSTLLVWCKSPHGLGPGGAFVLTTEYVLLATRGTLSPLRREPMSWFQWPRAGHSVKPDAFYGLVESITPGPYLELFARRRRTGWTVWGNEVAA